MIGPASLLLKGAAAAKLPAVTKLPGNLPMPGAAPFTLPLTPHSESLGNGKLGRNSHHQQLFEHSLSVLGKKVRQNVQRDTVVRCSDCTDCYECYDCYQCNRATDCTDCYGCSWCEGCSGCAAVGISKRLWRLSAASMRRFSTPGFDGDGHGFSLRFAWPAVITGAWSAGARTGGQEVLPAGRPVEGGASLSTFFC